MFDRLHTEPVYNTRAVALKTGVPADTFRAWERRYNLPIPCRSGGNQRLYCERDVAIISWLRDQTRAGMTISQAVALFLTMDRDDQAAIVEPRTNHANASGFQSSDGPSLDALEAGTHPARRISFFQACNQLIGALSQLNTPEAERIVEEVTAVATIDNVCHEVLLPALNEIRDRVERNEISSCVERFAHAFVKRKINALFSLSHPETGRGPVMAASVEGEHDELDLLCLSLSLSDGGFSVIYLGANIPSTSLNDAIRMLQPMIVLLNANSESTAPVLERTIQLLKAAEGDEQSPLIGFTGSVFERDIALRNSIHAPYFGCDGVQARVACDRLVGHASNQESR